MPIRAAGWRSSPRVLWCAARGRGRGHWHQRQDLGRLLRPPALGRPGYSAASPRHGRCSGPSGTQTLAHTTPDPVELHRIWPILPSPASPISRSKRRATGSSSAASTACGSPSGAFTNISRDHLDYHPSFEAYFDEKLRLFGELLPPGAGAVIDVDTEAGEARRGACEVTRGLAGDLRRPHRRRRCGSSRRSGTVSAAPFVEHTAASELPPSAFGWRRSRHRTRLFRRSLSWRRDQTPAVLAAAGNTRGARGPSRSCRHIISGAPIFVDYAHTPDALAKALDALRPYVRRGSSWCSAVAATATGQAPRDGRGGRRQVRCRYRHRRQSAQRGARAEIRRAILAAAPGAIEIGGRTDAVARAIAGLDSRRCVADRGQRP